MCSFSMCILFAIIYQARGGVLAGMIELAKALPAFLKIETACAVMFSAFPAHLCRDKGYRPLLNYSFEPPNMP